MEPTTRLRRTLLLDAAVCAASGLTLLVAAAPLAALLDTERPGAVRAVGAFLAVVAADIILVTRLRGDRLRLGTTAVAALNAAWVVATVALVAAGAFTMLGAMLALGTAAVVASFAHQEWTGATTIAAPVRA